MQLALLHLQSIVHYTRRAAGLLGPISQRHGTEAGRCFNRSLMGTNDKRQHKNQQLQ